MLTLSSVGVIQAQGVPMGILPGAEWIAIGTRNSDLGMISMSNSTLHYYDLEAGMAVVDVETWREQHTDNLTYYEEDRLQINVVSFVSFANNNGSVSFTELPLLCSVGWEESFSQWNETGRLLEKVGIILHPVQYLSVNITIRNQFGEYRYDAQDALSFQITYVNSTNYEHYVYLSYYGIMQKHSWNMFDEWGTWEVKILKLSTRDPYTPPIYNPFITILQVGAVGIVIVVIVVLYLRWQSNRKESEMVDIALRYRDEDEDEEW